MYATAYARAHTCASGTYTPLDRYMSRGAPSLCMAACQSSGPLAPVSAARNRYGHYHPSLFPVWRLEGVHKNAGGPPK
jgi:hypothetical protein